MALSLGAHFPSSWERHRTLVMWLCQKEECTGQVPVTLVEGIHIRGHASIMCQCIDFFFDEARVRCQCSGCIQSLLLSVPMFPASTIYERAPWIRSLQNYKQPNQPRENPLVFVALKFYFWSRRLQLMSGTVDLRVVFQKTCVGSSSAR